MKTLTVYQHNTTMDDKAKQVGLGLGLLSFFPGSSILSGVSFVSMMLFSARYGLSDIFVLIAVGRIDLMNSRTIRRGPAYLSTGQASWVRERHSMKNIIELFLQLHVVPAFVERRSWVNATSLI